MRILSRYVLGEFTRFFTVTLTAFMMIFLLGDFIEKIDDYIKSGRIKVSKRIDVPVTYHDPCHLKKSLGVAAQPRALLRANPQYDLQEMAEAAQLQPQYHQRQVNLTIARVPRRLPAVTGDRDLLGLAIYNLIENALKFTSSDDAVEVRALEDGRAIIVEVADSGPGIAPDDLRSIFEELYRGTNARGVEGSGLGLALAQRIVEGPAQGGAEGEGQAQAGDEQGASGPRRRAGLPRAGRHAGECRSCDRNLSACGQPNDS